MSGGACVACGARLVLGMVRFPEYHLYACASCGSWTQLPRRSAQQQADIHDSEDYFAHPYFRGRRTVTPAQRRRYQNVFDRLGDAVDLDSLRGRRLLDIGCDTSTFLRAARDALGIVPVGIDVASRAVALARELGVDAYQTTIERAPTELREFGVVTAIDLIEHVADPEAFLREVKQRMEPGGLLYLETPNIRSSVYRVGRALSVVTGGRPASLLRRLFPPEHIQYFTPDGLGRVARRAGFVVVSLTGRVLPLACIVASPIVLPALAGLQLCDRLWRRKILVCAVLRKPPGEAG